MAHTTYLAHTIQKQNEYRITKLLLTMSPVLPLENQDVKKKSSHLHLQRCLMASQPPRGWETKTKQKGSSRWLLVWVTQ